MKTAAKASGGGATGNCSTGEPFQKPASTAVFRYTWGVPKFVTTTIPNLLSLFCK